VDVLDASTSSTGVIALACWSLAAFILLALEHRVFERIDMLAWEGRRGNLAKLGHGIAMVLTFGAVTVSSLIWFAHAGVLSGFMLFVAWLFLWAAGRLAACQHAVLGR